MKDDNDLFPRQPGELSPSVYLGKACEKCGSRIKRRKTGECYRCHHWKEHLRDRYLKRAWHLHREGRRIPTRIQAMIMPEGKGFAMKLAAELSALDVTEEDYDTDGPKGWVFSYAKPLRDLPFQASDEVIRLFLQSWFVCLKSDGGRRADGR